ncbi:uncharacterized protein AAGF69_013533 isoform 1-T1 [Amazona ochrocephala]
MGVLSCVQHLMLAFNALVFAGGTSLAAVGLWVAVDPSGFQHIVAAEGVLSAGAFLLLAVGTALALLGFLGCCGALRRSRALLLGFFILVSLVFVTQLVGAVLFLLCWKRMQPELLLSELRRSYRGDEGAEVFSTAWNTLMVTDLKTLGTVPASRSCTRGRRGHACAAPGMGSCRQGSCWAGSSAGTGAPATSMSRAASPPSAGPCSSSCPSLGSAAWWCWASRSLPCSLPFAFITTSTEQDKAQQTQAPALEPAVGRMLQVLVRQNTALSFPACSFLRWAGAFPCPVSAPMDTGGWAWLEFLGAGTGQGVNALQAAMWSRGLW